MEIVCLLSTQTVGAKPATIRALCWIVFVAVTGEASVHVFVEFLLGSFHQEVESLELLICSDDGSTVFEAVASCHVDSQIAESGAMFLVIVVVLFLCLVGVWFVSFRPLDAGVAAFWMYLPLVFAA
ncbi:hypothetical protein U1Q18_038072, partial [Sarracenia purpurea var. burkii]